MPGVRSKEDFTGLFIEANRQRAGQRVKLYGRQRGAWPAAVTDQHTLGQMGSYPEWPKRFCGPRGGLENSRELSGSIFISITTGSPSSCFGSPDRYRDYRDYRDGAETTQTTLASTPGSSCELAGKQEYSTASGFQCDAQGRKAQCDAQG
jgi:hypothetical protein